MLAISSECLSISSRIAWVTAFDSPPGSGVEAAAGVPGLGWLPLLCGWPF